jgi:K+-sensing histidine kinase KdpD
MAASAKVRPRRGRTGRLDQDLLDERVPIWDRLASRQLVVLVITAALPPLLVAALLVFEPRRSADSLVGSVLLIGLLAGLLAFVIGRVLTLRLQRSHHHLLRVARRIADGDYAHLSEIESPWELRQLSLALESAGIHLESLNRALEHLEDVTSRQQNEQGREIDELRAEARLLQAEAKHLNEFAAAINQTVNPAKICAELSDSVADAVDFTWTAAFLVEPSGQEFHPVFINDRERHVRQVGLHLREAPNLIDLGDHRVARHVAQTGKPLCLGDGRDTRFREVLTRGFGQGSIGSLLIVPLMAKDRVLGVVEFAHPRPGLYRAEEEAFVMTLTRQAAMAIDNARLLEETAKVEALRELDRLKTDLLQTVSHELRTPLTSIMGFAETALDPDQSEAERLDNIHVIREESERLYSLISDLLTMSQIEAGRLKINRQPVLLGKVAQRVARKARLAAPEYQISASFAKGLPAADADLHKVEQVITNLVQNAVKYTPDGGSIRIKGFAAHRQIDGSLDFSSRRPDQVIVAVADEGVGIPSEYLSRVFERFFRVQSASAVRVGGSGLGLAIAKAFVEAHGGRIWVESPGRLFAAGNASRGSTFYFSVPAVRSGVERRDGDGSEEVEEEVPEEVAC